MRNWKYALSSADFAPESAPILLKGGICENLEEAALLGYQGLEIHLRETASLDYEQILKTIETTKVNIAALITGRLNTQGKVNLMDDRPYIVEAALKGMGQYIQMAARLKTDLVIGWVKGNIPEGGHPEVYLDRLARNLITICKEAEKQGVKIFLEVINRYEVNVFMTAKETVEFLNNRGIPNCYVHLDTFHMNIEEVDPVEAIYACKGRLGYFHVADNTRCYPGSGTLDFKQYFTALEKIKYEGYISLECLPEPDSKTAAKRAIKHLKGCNS